jgi:hypothetical protein
MRLIRNLVLLTAFLHFSLASAQENQDQRQEPLGTELGIHTGPLLPNQIQGMSEIQPMWGLRYSVPSGKGMLEFNVANSRAEGVVYYDAYLSYRYDVHMEEITGFLIVGADIHQWSSPPDDTTRVVPGVHVGTGIMMPLGDSLWFRSEMKFNMNPGTALYIGFGLVLKFPDEPGAAAGGG